MVTWIPMVLVGALACVAVAVMSVARPPRQTLFLTRISERLLLAVGAFLGVMVLGLALVTWAPHLLGLPLVLAPGVGVAMSMTIFGALPWRRTSPGAVRTAALDPRAAWSATTARIYRAPVLAALVLVVLLVVTGLTASLDDDGRSRAFTVSTPDSGNTASPYPGWFYAAPLLVATFAVVVAAGIAIRRTALLPATGLDAAVDAAWREGVAIVLSRIATAGLLLYLAAILLMAGGALRSVAGSVQGAIGLGATATLLAGAAAAVAAAINLLTAARRAAALSTGAAG